MMVGLESTKEEAPRQVADAKARAEALEAENTRLGAVLEGAAQGGTLGRYQDQRRKAEILQEELYRAETGGCRPGVGALVRLHWSNVSGSYKAFDS